jgi:hypothetical protein
MMVRTVSIAAELQGDADKRTFPGSANTPANIILFGHSNSGAVW